MDKVTGIPVITKGKCPFNYQAILSLTLRHKPLYALRHIINASFTSIPHLWSCRLSLTIR